MEFVSRLTKELAGAMAVRRAKVKGGMSFGATAGTWNDVAMSVTFVATDALIPVGAALEIGAALDTGRVHVCVTIIAMKTNNATVAMNGADEALKASEMIASMIE